MNIELTQHGSVGKRYYRADFTELCGSPYVGEGKTKHEAIACLFIRNREHVDKLIKANPILNINGKPWNQGYKSQGR